MKGFTWNHKRVYWIYRELKFNLRINRDKPDALSVPVKRTRYGRSLRIHLMCWTITTEKACVLILICQYQAQRVTHSLNQFLQWCGKPSDIHLDNSSEYLSQTLLDWANKKHITLLYIQPSKPTQNAYVERCNRTIRH